MFADSSWIFVEICIWEKTYDRATLFRFKDLRTGFILFEEYDESRNKISNEYGIRLSINPNGIAHTKSWYFPWSASVYLRGYPSGMLRACGAAPDSLYKVFLEDTCVYVRKELRRYDNHVNARIGCFETSEDQRLTAGRLCNWSVFPTNDQFFFNPNEKSMNEDRYTFVIIWCYKLIRMSNNNIQKL